MLILETGVTPAYSLGYRISITCLSFDWSETGLKLELYFSIPCRRLLEQWRRDLSVQTVSLPEAPCLELSLILARSTEQSPASMREMNGFQVSRTTRVPSSPFPLASINQPNSLTHR